MEYANLFHGKEKEALEKALDIRKFEIELYWKRTAYFWAFIVANYTAYFFVLAQDDLKNQSLYLTLLSFIGLLLAHAWQLSNKGSKFWQKNWEAHVSQLEKNVIGPLYDVFLDPRTPYTVLSPFEKYACSPARINTIVCMIFFITGLGLFLHNAVQFMNVFNFWLVLGVGLFIVIICLYIMTCLSFGHRHDDEPSEMIFLNQKVEVAQNDDIVPKQSIYHFVDRFFVRTIMIGNQIWMQNNVSKPVCNGCVVSSDSHKIDNAPSEEKERNYRILYSYCGGKIINFCESPLYSAECDDGYLKSVLITPEGEDDAAENLFYSWEAAMNIGLSDWHLPSLDEWMVLFKYMLEKGCSNFDLADKLKTEYGWTKTDNDGKIIRKEYKDSFGFSASPEGTLGTKWKYTKEGELQQNPNYSDVDDIEAELWGKGNLACFWSSTKRENGDVACIWIEDYVTIRYVPARQLPFCRYSVRLIKNQNELSPKVC